MTDTGPVPVPLKPPAGPSWRWYRQVEENARDGAVAALPSFDRPLGLPRDLHEARRAEAAASLEFHLAALAEVDAQIVLEDEYRAAAALESVELRARAAAVLADGLEVEIVKAPTKGKNR